jgi:hypothetical protein
MTTEWLDVSDITPRIGYIATASQTAFAVPFVFFENSDLRVYQDEVLLTLDLDYTVTGAEDEDGGVVTLVAGATVGDAILISRHVPIEQTTHIPPSGPLDVAAVNIQISKLIAIAQQLNDSFERSLRQPDSEALLDMELPAARENKILGFDSNGAPVAVLGPSSVADEFVGAALVESKAVAQVTDFDVTTNYLLVGGTSIAGDATLTGYIQGTGTGGFTDGGGTAWKPVPSSSGSFSLVTAVGNGVADDRAAIQATIDAVAAAGGGVVRGTTGAIYRVVSNVGVTDLGLIMKSGVTLDLNGATVNLECTGSVYGIRLQSNSHVIGPGAVKVTVSSSPGAAGCYHTPISAAVNYGEVTSVGALGNYINATNWSVRNLTLDSVRSDGNGMCFSAVGGQNHGLIEDIVIPDNSVIFAGIGCDWGTVGAIVSNDFPASRVAWNANLAYTVHPHDIVIRRIKIGAMTGAGSTAVRLSGCYKIKVEDVEVDSTVGAGFTHHGGDCGFEFAKPTPNVARWAYRGTTIRNFHVYDATVGVGFLFDCLGDNLQTAIAGGYVSLTAAIGTTDVLFEGCRSWSTSGATAGRGFWLQNCIGGTMRNCLAHRASFGVNIEAGVDNFLIDGGQFAYSYYDGITVSATDSPQDIAIIGSHLFENGQSGSGRAGVYFSTCIRPRVERCIIGTRGGDAAQSYGVNIDSTCTSAIVRDNHIAGVKAAGTGLNLATAANYGSFRLVSGNTFDTSVSTKFAGVNVLPIEYVQTLYGTYRRFITSRASAFSLTPGSGTWVVGDTIEFIDPLSTGWTGTKCTVAGTPGTWKNYGQLN